MTKKTPQDQTKTSYQFKLEALNLADRVGAAEEAKRLGLHPSQIYSWRTAINNKRTQGERESTLATENARLKRQLAEQAEELEIPKRRPPTSRSIKIKRFEFMRGIQRHLFYGIMARVLNVSRSGFYLWCNSSGRSNFRDERKQAIDERVKSVFEDSKCRDGADRIFVELTEKGTPQY